MNPTHSKGPSAWKQLLALVLMPLQVLSTMPVPVLLYSHSWTASLLAISPTSKVNRGARHLQLIKPQLNLPSDPSDSEIEMARVFPDPLFPVGTEAGQGENQSLATALTRYYKSRSVDSLTSYVSNNPNSKWDGALDYDIGVIHFQTGFLSLALQDWQASWNLLKADQRVPQHALADRAVGELVVLDAELGRTSELQRLFAEIGTRPLLGSGAERVHEAKQGFQIMRTHTSIAFKCGPFALDSIRTASKNRHPRSAIVEGAMSTKTGTSLAMVKAWSDELGMNYQMAKRSPGTSFIVPSVMHWKLGHFGALVRVKKNRYLIQDPTFGGSELWVAPAALEAETSGYFLVPAGKLPPGWTSVGKTEASKVWGRGGAKASNPAAAEPSTCPKPGMTAASFYPMTCALSLADTPVVYTAPVGPQVNLTVNYNSQEPDQPANYLFSNFGYNWTFTYLTYLSVDPSQNVTVTLPGGFLETYKYSSFDNVNNVFAPDPISQAQLYITAAGTYERCMPDGSKYVYSQPDGTGRILLTQVYDPQGNSLTMTYDGNFRLSSIQDQLLQSTTLGYLSNSPGTAGFYSISSITDPFGRSAQFLYDITGTELTKIIDVVGINSQFTYDGSSFIDSLTTPYGKTLFYKYTPSTDPTGLAVGIKFTFPDGTQSISENWLQHELNTYFWSRKESPSYPDKTKARVTHWMQEAEANVESPIIAYTKEPLEGSSDLTSDNVPTGPSYIGAPIGAVVYAYPGSYQVFPTVGSIDPATGLPVPPADAVAHNYVGSSNQPTSIARVLSTAGGQMVQQISLFTANVFGHLTSYMDPIGRSYQLSYDANNIDLLEVRQIKGGSNDLLAKFIYNNQHEPLSYIDGSGQKSFAAYNAQGQVTSRTDARGGVTTYNYDGNGYLLSVDGPLAGSNDKTTYTYDGPGRIHTVSDSEGYTRTFGYDNLDRVTSVTYPDGTFEQVTWNRLDPVLLRDRLGNWTQQQFDSMDQLVKIIDPLGRSIQYQWCTCGALGSITDGAGSITSWNRDLQGRPMTKTYANQSQEVYQYEANTSRLHMLTDARGLAKTYTYNTDDTLSQVAYNDSTPGVSYGYDGNYNRITSIATAGGPTYGYSYNNYVTNPYGAAVTGAGRVQQITNSLLGSSAAITFSYDELGRTTGRSIGSSAVTTSYDPMSRVTGISNPLGSFIYQYVDDVNTLGSGSDKGTTRLAKMIYPNGQVANYSYLSTGQDERLAEIKNLTGANAVLSQFDYGYDAKGQITSWKQQTDSNPATRYDIGYDAAGQLNSDVLKTDATNAVLHQYYYNYDSAGNRVSEQIDSSVTQTGANNLNQITGQTAGGTTRFQGILSKPGTVTVNGQAATMPTSTNFVANPSLNGGTNTVAVVATDGSGNTATNNYQVVIPATGGTVTPSYDTAGNMLTNVNGQTYQWDAENRLTQITQGSNTYQFAYDGLGRRISETDNGTLTKQWVWVGTTLAEERNASGTVTKRFFGQGEQIAGSSYYYTKDHLGSVREMTDSSGNIQARYSYDPYGRVTPAGTISLASDFQYAGYYEHAGSGLNLTLYRAYDSNTARWLSKDPLTMAEMSQGPNMYEYVRNNPLKWIDKLGRQLLSPDEALKADANSSFTGASDFDSTAIGNLSAFNLWNGNGEDYINEMVGYGSLKVGLGLAVGSKCPAAAPALTALGLFGTALSALSTISDAAGRALISFFSTASNNQPGYDPDNTYGSANNAAVQGVEGTGDPANVSMQMMNAGR